ncbi:MAG: serine/threonine-protein kinase, partial [Planctomycetota bacterium]
MPSDADSILARIGSRGGRAPRVKLRELADDAPFQLEEIALRQTGRYEIVGQIAQGGVGQVLKGHDVDLGRDVAMKVLLERHNNNPDLVRRFVEEAQIGGQLQHPGVVPVYELGLQADKRPYFAMKLVKG